MKFNDQDAQNLATVFREAAKAIGDYLYEKWHDLAPADSGSLGQMYVTLKNTVAHLPTHAAGVVIDEGQVSLTGLLGATKEATDAFRNIADVKKAIAITTALIDLAAAIPAGKTETIAATCQNLQKATSA
ncbi:MAG: hypothetical protein PHD65_09595 [Gallionella sp.]|nr:hypothetical protein [Gallionella sp.]